MAEILVTGAAGFLGMHVSAELCKAGYYVLGIDNLNSYYDPRLKEARLAELTAAHKNFTFSRIDLTDEAALARLFEEKKFSRVVHLGAQAGVRYSITNPMAYQDSNLKGTTVILDLCARHQIGHLIYASSSSVYGANTKVPFQESDPVERPVSFYAATKRANELMAHTFSLIHQLPATGLRFFTVYGPWGRPDMAYWSFTDALMTGKKINVFGDGIVSRDFTYVDDVVSAVVRLVELPPAKQAENQPAHRILNVGNSAPITVNAMLQILESLTGKKANRVDMPLPLGDVAITFADSSALAALTGYRPNTELGQGLDKFVSWYKKYFEL
jgi:UDP-glucuronate 4-epimerase